VGALRTLQRRLAPQAKALGRNLERDRQRFGYHRHQLRQRERAFAQELPVVARLVRIEADDQRSLRAQVRRGFE